MFSSSWNCSQEPYLKMVFLSHSNSQAFLKMSWETSSLSYFARHTVSLQTVCLDCSWELASFWNILLAAGVIYISPHLILPREKAHFSRLLYPLITIEFSPHDYVKHFFFFDSKINTTFLSVEHAQALAFKGNNFACLLVCLSETVCEALLMRCVWCMPGKNIFNIGRRHNK